MRYLPIVVILVLFGTQSAVAQCGCDFVVSDPNLIIFDAAARGVQPGDKICIANGTRQGMMFKNINGTVADPVIITNMCDGVINFVCPANWGNCITFDKCKNYRFTGSSNPAVFYGVTVSGASMGVQNYNLSTDMEIDQIYINNTSCQGLAAKTDPNCEGTSVFGAFTMQNCKFHDLKIENTGCEGFYIGESHFDDGVNITCSGVPRLVFEHAVDNVQVYNNILINIGNDGIQVGSTTNCVVYNNRILGTGAKNNPFHQNGIQMGDGTTGATVYNNYIETARGYGVFDSGGGGTYYNNVITNSLQDGFFLRDRAPNHAPKGFTIVNNTIINSNTYGVYNLSDNPNMSYFRNNILVHPTTQYVYLNGPTVKWTESNNIKTTNINSVAFVNAPTKDYRLQSTAANVINMGMDVTGHVAFSFDHDRNPRPRDQYDIGAFEFQTGGPAATAGEDKTINLPTNSVTLNGGGTSSTGITGYQWTQKEGPVCTLANATTANLTVSAMGQGTYKFELRVTDASGFAFDEAIVNVLPVAANQNPVANAGPDRTAVAGSNVTINGQGTDADGSIQTYAWSKLLGPTFTLGTVNQPNLALNGIPAGTYTFQLTVTDNQGASSSDQMILQVNPAAVNQPPVVNAGTDKTIFLPTTQVTLTATAGDVDGQIQSFLWEKVTGGTATIATPSQIGTLITGLALGNYKFRITARDDDNAVTTSEVNVFVLQGNQSPTVDAGANQSISLPTNSTTITGTANDADGTVNTYLWAYVSGPASYSLAGQATLSLTVNSMVQGAYVFSLTVTDDDGATAYDEVTIAVNLPAAGPNEIPIAIAGDNLSFALPTNSVNLYGAGFDADGAITTYAWVKASGGNCTLTNADKPTLTVSALEAGQYTFKLVVTDDDGATDEDFAVVTISALGTNIFPVASAGADQVVRLPLTTLTLRGSGFDEDGTISAYAWTKISGGAAASIASPTAAESLVTGLAEGNYVFRLTVTDDDGGTDFNDITVRVVASTFNTPPSVNAGEDIRIFLPNNTLTINASAFDDGEITTYQWVKLSGPAATLATPTIEDLDVTGLVQGEYSFQLIVTDNNAASVFDIVKVFVLPAAFTPPVVNAGADQTIFLPTTTASLTGTASSTAGTITSTTWAQTVGPTSPAVVLTGATTLNLGVTNLQEGSYVFTLTAEESTGVKVSDNVVVTVNPEPPNQAPFVATGANVTIVLPTSQVSLTGSATDSDGTVSSTVWSLVSGPNTPALTGTTTLTMSATGLIEGLYIFKLSATDNDGDVGFNDVLVLVTNPAPPTNQPPVAFAGEDVVLTLPENSVTIQGEGVDPGGGYVDSYVWTQEGGPPATFSTVSDFVEISDLIKGEYLFRLTVADTALSSFDDVRISVIEKIDEIPKFFSPNNDGYGETWVIRNIESYQTCGLLVMNRAGQTVYEAKPYDNNWNGTSNGKPLNDGDYYYIFKCDDGRVLTGALRIIR